MKATQRAKALEQFIDNRLFEGVNADVLERIAPKIDIVRKEQGEIIFRKGEPSDSLYLVAQGSVKIAKAAEGSEPEILDFFSPAIFFGASAMLARELPQTTATSVEPIIIGSLGEDSFQQI